MCPTHTRTQHPHSLVNTLHGNKTRPLFRTQRERAIVQVTGRAYIFRNSAYKQLRIFPFKVSHPSYYSHVQHVMYNIHCVEWKKSLLYLRMYVDSSSHTLLCSTCCGTSYASEFSGSSIRQRIFFCREYFALKASQRHGTRAHYA